MNPFVLKLQIAHHPLCAWDAITYQSTLIELGKTFLKSDYHGMALMYVTSRGQKLPNETLEALFSFLLNGNFARVLFTIENIAEARQLPEWFEANVLEKADSKDLNATMLLVLHRIAEKQKQLQPQTVEKLLFFATQSNINKNAVKEATLAMSHIDLTSQLETIKQKKLGKETLTTILSNTPLEAIVRAKFTPEATALIITNRLIERQTPLYQIEDNLAYFENGKLQKIPLDKDQIDKLIPAIRKTWQPEG